MAQTIRARVTRIAFGVELAFALVIPIAYLRLFEIDRWEDCATVIAAAASLYVVRTAALVAWLAWLLLPIDRWALAATTSQPEPELTRQAARAAYDSPLVFALVWATSWLVYYLPVTALLRGAFPERIPLTEHAWGATLLFGVSCFAAALPLSYALLGWLLGPVAGRISLSARERGLQLPGRRVSLRARLIVLSLSLIVAPTAWMGLTAYMSQSWTAQRALSARAVFLADAVAHKLEASPARTSWEPLTRTLSTPFDVVAVAAADGTILANEDAARELAAARGLRFRLSRSLSRGPADTVLDPRARRAAAYRVIPGANPPAVALVISRGPENHQGGEIISLLLFALVALSWAPICAAFLAGSIVGPLERIRTLVSQIILRGDVAELDRIPVFHRDEIGELAQGTNEMIDRLQAASERIRRYGEDREDLLAEAARRASQLDAVLNNMVEGVFACDRIGCITHTNAAAQRLLELSPALGDRRAAAERDGAQMPLHPDGRPFSAAELPLVRALAGEVIVEEDEVLENVTSHRSVFLRSSAAPIRDASGEISGAVAVARDVTEVVELDRLKDQFIRVAAHELKTPVAIVKGYSLTLMRTDETLSPRSRRMLEAIDRGAERIHRIVEDLIEVSQAFLDVLKISPVPVDLDALVRAAVAALPTSALERVVVRRTGSGPLTVRADPVRTRRALANLLSNALKYSPAGGTIEVMLGADSLSGEAECSIRDQGVGIPREGQERIFHLFYSAHTDSPNDYGGMGVGLYMAKELIKRQDGRIWFESEEGKGSTFSFALPLS
jgi:signal transduction histidine kinase